MTVKWGLKMQSEYTHGPILTAFVEDREWYGPFNVTSLATAFMQPGINVKLVSDIVALLFLFRDTLWLFLILPCSLW